MKNIITIILMAFLGSVAVSQVPAAFNYQGIAANSAGETIKNSPLGLKVSIIENDMNAQPVYQEINNSSTTSIGHFSIKVGRGTVTLGDFANINWQADAHFLRIEMDIDGGDNYTVEFLAPLTAVPFAYVVDSSDNNPQGRMGEMGDEGNPGLRGPQGAQGATGATGAQGPAGPRGSVGPAGFPGPAGMTGAQGAQGDRGLPGLDGAPGAEGVAGPAGSQGLPGPPGVQGAHGARGDQGPPGPTGVFSTIPGPIGEQGPTGYAGGPQGPQGDLGPRGVPGVHGADGAQGLQGLRFYEDENFNITSVVPQNPEEGEMYIDDGTNRMDGKAGFRVYHITGWFDL